MRACACLWGGQYNPIIPVFRVAPDEWKGEFPENMSGAEIARGYVDFFEPDIYVEAKPQMLEKVGLEKLRVDSPIHRRVIALDEMLAPQPNKDWSEVEVGLNINDALLDIFRTEQRFELRDKRPAYIVKPTRGTGFVEAMYGVYPSDAPSGYISENYRGVFKPKKIKAGPDTWKKIFRTAAITPMRVTRYKLERDRSWHNDPVFFVFDANKSTDLIDLWNLRIEPDPIIPVPIDWWPDVLGDVEQTIREEFRPLQGNPNGEMHSTTIEFARSISTDAREQALAQLSEDLPHQSWSSKAWRTRIWDLPTDSMIVRARPIRVTAQEKRVRLRIKDKDPPIADFEALSPDFASIFGGGHNARWVNVVNVHTYSRHEFATVLPFNAKDTSWPKLDYLGEKVVVGTEGWAFTQQFKDSTETIRLQLHEEAIIGSLAQLGVDAKVSDPGHIAKQVLHHLGGMWGVHVLADKDTVVMLNQMAGGVRRRGDGEDEIEEIFERRTRPARQWNDLLAQRRQRRPLADIKISNFTDRNILRLGLTTKCPHCTATNWHGLTAADYEIACERCLEKYPFPQGELMPNNGNWSYRVIGPFATPDYARGSYGALLALNVLDDVGNSRGDMTFSTALELQVDDGPPCEADYVAWISRQSSGEVLHPELVIGEAKSLGDGDLVKPRDIAQLRRIATKLPGATIVISVIRDDFTDAEKETIEPFVRWARRLNERWEPTNPVVLLTGVELFHEFHLSTTWRDLGGRYEPFANYNHTKDLKMLAEATQTIYLGLPPFHEDRRAERARRAAQRQQE